MNQFDAQLAHQHEMHTIAMDALRIVARTWRTPYPIIRDRFIGGDFPITAEFWRVVHARYPGRFAGVDWCHGCRKFNLHPRLLS